MNTHDRDLGGEPAILQFSMSDYAVLRPGRFVLCAVTGRKLPLETLKYWSADLQEAYAGPAEATKRWLETNKS